MTLEKRKNNSRFLVSLWWRNLEVVGGCYLIPTGWRQTSWLFTIAAEKLNLGVFRWSLILFFSDTILKFLVEWNTNSKNCHVAQTGNAHWCPKQLCKFNRLQIESYSSRCNQFDNQSDATLVRINLNVTLTVTVQRPNVATLDQHWFNIGSALIKIVHIPTRLAFRHTLILLWFEYIWL